MSFVALCAFALTAIAEEPQRPIADGASEGARDLAKLNPVLKKLIVAQPYGKTWLELAKTEPAPTDRTGLGAAKTHDQLKNDPMELQQQAYYAEPTATAERYGSVVVRGERVFRYGKLSGVRVVLEPAGKPERAIFVEDVAALAAAWPDVVSAFGIGDGYRVVKNDLIDQKKKKPDAYPLPPLMIELQPRPGNSK